MPLSFNNINTLWSSLIAETFATLGVKNAVISPGSRSTPLTIAFAEHKQIKTIPILDERSAAFFALGIAKRTYQPTILICTSGTAGANFYPAIIEARYSHVPLIILTADRPFELRNCHAGQAIEQINLYANYPQWQTELSLPSIELNQLFYLRQTIIHAWEKSCFPHAGVVHLNIPFQEPLSPCKQLHISQEKQSFITEQLLANLPIFQVNNLEKSTNIKQYLIEWSKSEKGIIIAGVDSPQNNQQYCQTIALLSQQLNFPILAEALSPVRNYSDLYQQNLIVNYDIILRIAKYAQELLPEVVILIGKYPTSKILRSWLNTHKIKTYIIVDHEDNVDALHTNSVHLRTNLTSIKAEFPQIAPSTNINNTHKWKQIDQQINHRLQHKLSNHQEMFEGKIVWMLSQYLPVKTPVVIANSMSVRYAEYFWQKNDRQFQIYFSRGANGIDGTLSTALGIAHQNPQPTILLTGDLALLHDTNGFLIRPYLQGSLIIILVNNNGGGIFEMLPIAEYESLYEDYFATPQSIDFCNLVKTYNVDYQLINSWQQLQEMLTSLPTKNVHLWEIKTDRKIDRLRLKNLLEIQW